MKYTFLLNPSAPAPALQDAQSLSSSSPDHYKKYIQPKCPSSAAAPSPATATTSRPAPRGGRTVLCSAQSPISQLPSADAPTASPLLRPEADSRNPLSNPNRLPPSYLNPPPPLSLPPHSPTQSTVVLYPDPSPFRRARHELSAGGNAAGAARASPPRAMSPPSTTAPSPPPPRPPSRAPPDSSLDRDDLDTDPVAATTEALAKVNLSDDPDATATTKSGSSKPHQVARGGGCDVGKSTTCTACAGSLPSP
ncbi:vegetative cell wall protein gp1-like [Triticum dicoccoides]|uniref:vegetative cell wall protein gp1-like n=1 Tax=Triticum dicoccoides TaxID=85692 RepID=UPI00189004FA|nr:vegetative cell wall protein gp1-like [Triticum dicoccoides]